MMRAVYSVIISMLRWCEDLVYEARVRFVEWRAIFRKRDLYKDAPLAEEEAQAFREFWRRAGVRGISSRWHRLYKSINGVFLASYIPDHLFSARLERILNPPRIAEVLSDKAIAQRVFSGTVGVRFPELVVVGSNNLMVDVHGNYLSPEQACELIGRHKELVAKPTTGGSSGRSVRLIDIEQSADDLAEMLDELATEFGDGFVLQERINPHASLRALSPTALSTIRVITYLHAGKVHHGLSALRMGMSGSFVDNVHGGGLVVAVDGDGRLGRKAYKLGYCDSAAAFEDHPETGQTFALVVIPMMPQVISAAKRMHAKTPSLGMVSWDMTVSDSNEVICIEANLSGQSVWFPQICNEATLFGSNTEEVLRSLLAKR